MSSPRFGLAVPSLASEMDSAGKSQTHFPPTPKPSLRDRMPSVSNVEVVEAFLEVINLSPISPFSSEG
jgi:hypothetical protein